MSTERASQGEGRDLGLEQYRGYGRFYERYWSRLFGMTQADMARFADQMRARRTALDLTTLARDVIAARLRLGPQLNSGPAPNGSMPSHVVRLWDPAAMWRVGDRAIMAVPSTRAGRNYAPAVGEIRQVGDDHVIVQVDGLLAPQVHALGLQSQARFGAFALGAGAPSLADEIVSLADREDEGSQIDYILWRFGGSVVGRLLHALQADSGFVELEGLWYRVELAAPLREVQLVALARAMFAGPARPITIPEILMLLAQAEETEGARGKARDGSAARESDDARHFGAALALQERPDLFTNAGSPSHPRWALAGPPPVRFVANHAVYDPETYVVWCTPGETLSPQAARRLWDAGLLRAALGESGEPGVGSDSPAGEHLGDARPRKGTPLSVPEPAPKASLPRSLWRRWLPFGQRD